MMTAKTPDGRIVIATSADKSDGPFQCSECSRQATIKKGTWKIHHFAHRAGEGHVSCDKKNESEQHATIKLAIYEAARIQAGVVDAFMEFRTGERIADVAIFGQRRKVAVEVQLSPITADEIEDRTDAHFAAGFSTLWVVRPSVELSKVKRGVQYKIRAFQRDIHDTGSDALFVHREGLWFDVVHLMGYRYETFKHFKVSYNPLHLFQTTDHAGRVIPPKTARWWESLEDDDDDSVYGDEDEYAPT